MKKATMIIAAMGMFSGAFADKTTVVQPVSVEVANVCTYGAAWTSVPGNPPVNPTSTVPGNQTDVNGKTYTDGTRQNIGNYKANASTTGNPINQTYIFRCTKGTVWNTHTGTKTLTLTSTKDSSTLLVKATTAEQKTPDSNNSGDIYQGSASFVIDAGQYSSTAGHYEGNLTIVVDYN